MEWLIWFQPRAVKLHIKQLASIVKLPKYGFWHELSTFRRQRSRPIYSFLHCPKRSFLGASISLEKGCPCPSAAKRFKNIPLSVPTLPTCQHYSSASKLRQSSTPIDSQRSGKFIPSVPFLFFFFLLGFVSPSANDGWQLCYHNANNNDNQDFNLLTLPSRSGHPRSYMDPGCAAYTFPAA